LRPADAQKEHQQRLIKEMIIITIIKLMVFNAHKIKVHILVVTDYELYIIEINRELTSHMWFNFQWGPA